MARRLMREEGLMCGSTSGEAMWAAIKMIKEKKIGAGKRCVVILPDSIRNFMTKLLNDDWMYEQGFISENECAKGAISDLIPNTEWGQDMKVSDLDLPEAVFIDADLSVSEVVTLFRTQGFAQYPVKDSDGKILGVVTKASLMEKLVKKRVT